MEAWTESKDVFFEGPYSGFPRLRMGKFGISIEHQHPSFILERDAAVALAHKIISHFERLDSEQ